MLSELYGAFRRKGGADEPPTKAAAEAVVIEGTRFRSIDGRFDALSHTMDQRLDTLSRMIDERFATINQRFAAIDQYFATMDVPLVRLETKVAEMDAQLARLDTKTATAFRHLRWGLDIVIALLFVLVTKVILDWAMP
jgi:hypothetical protein